MVWSILMDWKKPTDKKIKKEDIPATKQIQDLIDNLENTIKKLEKVKKGLNKK